MDSMTELHRVSAPMAGKTAHLGARALNPGQDTTALSRMQSIRARLADRLAQLQLLLNAADAMNGRLGSMHIPTESPPLQPETVSADGGLIGDISDMLDQAAELIRRLDYELTRLSNEI